MATSGFLTAKFDQIAQHFPSIVLAKAALPLTLLNPLGQPKTARASGLRGTAPVGLDIDGRAVGIGP